MCIIGLSHGDAIHETVDFVLVNNRDEAVARSTRAPFFDAELGVYAGRDLVKGGTWLGIHAHTLWRLLGLWFSTRAYD